MENRRGDDGIPEDLTLDSEALIADESDADSPPAATSVWRTHGTPASSVSVTSRARSREHHLVYYRMPQDLPLPSPSASVRGLSYRQLSSTLLMAGRLSPQPSNARSSSCGYPMLIDVMSSSRSSTNARTKCT